LTLRDIFVIFLAITFEWIDLAMSYSVWRYDFKMSVARFSFKVIRSRSRQQKTAVHGFVLPRAQFNFLSSFILFTGVSDCLERFFSEMNYLLWCRRQDRESVCVYCVVDRKQWIAIVCLLLVVIVIVVLFFVT